MFLVVAILSANDYLMSSGGRALPMVIWSSQSETFEVMIINSDVPVLGEYLLLDLSRGEVNTS